MKNLKSTKSRVIQSLAVLIVLTGLIPMLGIFSGGRQSANASDITEYIVPTSNSNPNDITSGPDGNLWFTEDNGNNIGKISPSGAITEFPVPTYYSQPNEITTGPDGNLWFTEWGGNNIGQISPSGAITEFPVPTSNSQPSGITTGPDGNLWFTEWGGNNIGQITPNGAITEFPVPTSNSQPNEITTGPDGNLWFTEQGGNIGKITPSGAITEFPVPTGGNTPSGITSGPDGNLWFTEGVGNKIGVLYLSGITPSPNPSPTTASGNAYVALGDSYSSGEGITPFFEPTNPCHRSTFAYPTLVNIPNTNTTYYNERSVSGNGFGFLACSGATSTDVQKMQLSTSNKTLSSNFVALGPSTQLVTITVGGDDLDFATVLSFCASKANCANDTYGGKTLQVWLADKMIQLRKDLIRLYQNIHAKSLNARLLVLGYPQIFPATKAEQDCIQLLNIKGQHHYRGFSNNDQNFLRTEGMNLNTTIASAVSGSNIPNVTFLPVANVFAGHEVCGNAGAWINGPSLNANLSPKDYSFHPTNRGQAMYAHIINTLLQGIPGY